MATAATGRSRPDRPASSEQQASLRATPKRKSALLATERIAESSAGAKDSTAGKRKGEASMWNGKGRERAESNGSEQGQSEGELGPAARHVLRSRRQLKGIRSGNDSSDAGPPGDKGAADSDSDNDGDDGGGGDTDGGEKDDADGKDNESRVGARLAQADETVAGVTRCVPRFALQHNTFEAGK